MRKIIPLILALVGLGGGIGAGLALRPAPEPPSDTTGSSQSGPDTPAPAAQEGAPDAETSDRSAEGKADAENPTEFVKLNNQFIVPIVKDGAVGALVILSVSLEVASGKSDEVYSDEPKLRDSFLQILFDHANAGGFDGAFTNAINMDNLRTALLEAGVKILPGTLKKVLITDIVRQDN